MKTLELKNLMPKTDKDFIIALLTDSFEEVIEVPTPEKMVKVEDNLGVDIIA